MESDDCDYFSSKTVLLTQLTQDRFYRDVYTFWMQPVVLTYVPFALLLTINCLIICRFYFRAHTEVLSEESRKNAKDAVLTTVSIVTCYLCSNILSLILSILEMIRSDIFNHSPILHHLLSDVTSFMVMVVCCIRYPIYLLCNTTIRRETRKALNCRRQPKTLSFKHQLNQFVRVSEAEIFV